MSSPHLPNLALATMILLAGTAAHAAPVAAVAFSPDGAALVATGDRSLEVRSVKDASVERRIDCGLVKVTSIAFAPGGKLLVAGGGEPAVRGEAVVFSWPDGKLLRRLGEHTDMVTSVVFDAATGRLAVASADGTARVWSLAADGAAIERFALRGHAGPVLTIAFSPAGSSIVTGSADRSLKVWSTDDGALLRTFTQHTEAVRALAFRPRPAAASEAAPAACASASDDRTVRIWQPEIGRMVRIVRGHEGPPDALAWLPDGSALFSAGREGIVRRIDAESDAVQTSWRSSDDWIYALAVSPDGSRLAVGDWAGQVRLHELSAQ